MQGHLFKKGTREGKAVANLSFFVSEGSVNNEAGARQLFHVSKDAIDAPIELFG